MKKLALLLAIPLLLCGCENAGGNGGSDKKDDINYEIYNNYVFSEMVVDGTRGYCVTGYYGTEEKINLKIPATYQNLPILGVSFDHSYYSEKSIYNNYLESIHFPYSVKLINWGGIVGNIDDDETQVIFDADVKYMIGEGRGDREFYERGLEKVYFNGSIEEFNNSNLDKFFRVSDIYFKEGNEYKCKIERREEISYVLDKASQSSEIHDAACAISNTNKEVTLPTELEVEYKGELKKVTITYNRIYNSYSYGETSDFVLDGNKLKYIGGEPAVGGTYLTLNFYIEYRNVTKYDNIDFSVVFNDIFRRTLVSMEGGKDSPADMLINDITDVINGKSISSMRPSKFFLVFFADTSENCSLLKYPMATINKELFSIYAQEETSDSTDYTTAFAKFLERHQDFFELAGGAAYDTDYYANGYLSSTDIEYLETADPNNFLTPTILLIELNGSGKTGVTEVAFNVRGNNVEERQQFLNDMWNHTGPFAQENR